MTLDPLPPISPEAPLPARASEPDDEAFAEHLDQPTEEDAPSRPQAPRPQSQDALVNWAALIPTTQNPVQPQTQLPTPIEPDAVLTPISTEPAQAAQPQVPSAPVAQPTETPAATLQAAPAQPEAPVAASQDQPETQPVRTETNVPQAVAQTQPATPNAVEGEIVSAPTECNAPQTPAAPTTQAADAGAGEATPDAEPAPQPQAPPALALFTAPQPAAPRPQQQTQTDAQQPTEEIAPLRADREAPAKHVSPIARPDPQQQQSVAAAQPNQTAPRESAPTQQAPAPTPAPPPVDTSAATPQPAGIASAEAARTQEPASAAPAQRAASPAAQVAQQIVRRVENGATRFELRLDPPELGRVDVRLEMSRDHQVVAHITADDAAALQQLVRSAREIEWALQSAGLELSQNGLSFDLADRGAAQSSEREAPRLGAAADPVTTAETPAAPARALMLERWRGARVDLTA